MTDCAHMFQSVDLLGRFTCVDCGASCGSGEWVSATEPLTRSQMEVMRTEFETSPRDRPDLGAINAALPLLDVQPQDDDPG